ncbi:MAG: hypothetical protein AAF720_09275 [Pseudomonadota bacterium]
MTSATATITNTPKWIKDARFDRIFIFGLPTIAILSACVIAVKPSLFTPILLVDLWLLGYHHVVSTYTRLCFDKQSFQEHRFLLTWLIPIVAIPTILIALTFGVVAIVTIYFYWQWWHYTRQSWGVSRIFRGRDPDAIYEDNRLDQAIFYSVPIFGVLSRSSENHSTFIGLEFYSAPVHEYVAVLAGYIALALLAFWVVRRYQAYTEGRLAILHTSYMMTHFLIFGIAYYTIPEITVGWLVINIWHNAQYILFVWLFNNKRFKDGVDPSARFLSSISQSGKIWHYLGACLMITGVVYWGIIRSIDHILLTGVSATIVIYQIVNFHHYVVDSVIWKVRKPAMRQTLNLKTAE